MQLLSRYRAWKRRRHVARLIVKLPCVFGCQRPSRIELLVYGDNVAFPKAGGAEEFEKWRTANPLKVYFLYREKYGRDPDKNGELVEVDCPYEA